MTAEQAQLVAAALCGGCDGEHDLLVNACDQAADELNVIGQAAMNGASTHLIVNAITGVEERLRAAAKLAGVLELECESADEKSEARQ